MTVWFTSDLHFGHAKVAELRGFDSVDSHDSALVAGWLKVVKPEHQVWVLGDIATSEVDYALALIETLPGDKHLISGNHDACHPMHRNAHRQQWRYLDQFASVQPFARRKIAGQDVMLSHFPYNRDRGDIQRYPDYRLRNLGKWLLHGHTHDSQRLHGSEIHVGVDAWDLAPVSINTIADMIAGKA